MALEISIKQIQTVSQRVIQTNRILQLTARELEQYIQEESENNPVIEFVEDPGYSGFSQRSGTSEEENGDFWNISDTRITVQEHLLSQITQPLSPKERIVLDYLLNSLDDNGYMRADLSETASRLTVSISTVSGMLELIQSLEPEGIGARDLSECLLIQLKRQGYTDEKLLLFVSSCLDLLAENKMRKIREMLRCSDEDIRDYVDIIRTLDPRPGSVFQNQDKGVFIVPDIYVEEGDNGFVIRFNEHLYHRIRVQEEYRSMYRSLKGEEKAYLKDKIQRVSLLQRSIAQREQMITSLTAYVVQRQESFFQRGEGNLTSLRMQDAADILKVHVSTISRAVNGKYLQCEWGIYPLKYFFTQGKEDGPVRTDLRKLIRVMIREEDKEQPLSDSMIERKLKEKGIEIARRTVAKYRKAEGIPDVYKRKIN